MNKRRKKSVSDSYPCVDPISDMIKFMRDIDDSYSQVLVLPEIYIDKLKELEQRWLQSQNNVL